MVVEPAPIYHKRIARAVGRINLGTLNIGASIFTTFEGRRDRSESVVRPSRAHTWLPRCDTLTDLSFEEVFGSLRYHRSRHHRVTRTRARDGAPTTASPHRGVDVLASGEPSKFRWPSIAKGPFGSRLVDSHLERNGLGLRGLCGRSYDLAANSWAVHPSKVALDVGSGPSHLRDRPRGAAQKAAPPFAYSMTLKSMSKEWA
jgi:hypothetical protein